MSFVKSFTRRIAATKDWHNRLIIEQSKISSQKKRDQLKEQIDILAFWIDVGEHVQKFMCKK